MNMDSAFKELKSNYILHKINFINESHLIDFVGRWIEEESIREFLSAGGDTIAWPYIQLLGDKNDIIWQIPEIR